MLSAVLLARAAREFNISHAFETSVTFSGFKSRWMMLGLSFEHILDVFEMHRHECELYRWVVLYLAGSFKMTGINSPQNDEKRSRCLKVLRLSIDFALGESEEQFSL